MRYSEFSQSCGGGPEQRFESLRALHRPWLRFRQVSGSDTRSLREAGDRRLDRDEAVPRRDFGHRRAQGAFEGFAVVFVFVLGQVLEAVLGRRAGGVHFARSVASS